jgi:hypothetical protein
MQDHKVAIDGVVVAASAITLPWWAIGLIFPHKRVFLGM